jgi:Tfp pilus assembly protein PilV
MFSRHSHAGFSTIECLLALVILTVGVLGSAGTMGLAVRAVHAGAAAATAARLVVSLRDSLQSRVIAAGGACSALSGGSNAASPAVQASWVTVTVPGGREIELTVTRPGLRASLVDTVAVFIACR